MNITELTARVRQVSEVYAKTNAIERDRAWYAFKVAEEAGEVSKAFLAVLGQSRAKTDTDVARRELADELADLIAHALLLADNEQLSVQEAIERKWLRYLVK